MEISKAQIWRIALAMPIVALLVIPSGFGYFSDSREFNLGYIATWYIVRCVPSLLIIGTFYCKSEEFLNALILCAVCLLALSCFVYIPVYLFIWYVWVGIGVAGVS